MGEKLTIKVSLNTASAKWKGSAEHTVTEGTNRVSIKLKKTAAGLNNLLFGTDKPYSGNPHDYTLKLKIGSEEIEFPHIRYHNFCRDNKGRTYFAYNTGNTWVLERYTSEGEKEDKTFGLPGNVTDFVLASDAATGAVYFSVLYGHDIRVYRINEGGGSPTELIGTIGDMINKLETYAVYNNILVSAFTVYSVTPTKKYLNMYRIKEDNSLSLIKSSPYDLDDDIKISLQVGQPPSIEKTIH